MKQKYESLFQVRPQVVLDWLNAKSQGGNSLNDGMTAYLKTKGATNPATLGEAFNQVLSSLGYTGTLSDKLGAFYKSKTGIGYGPDAERAFYNSPSLDFSNGTPDPITGFKQIADFTSAGSESSMSVTVNSDVDLEYRIDVFNTSTLRYLRIVLNSDTGANYGYQFIYNTAGVVTAARSAVSELTLSNNIRGLGSLTILAPVGFIKTCFDSQQSWLSGTTVNQCGIEGQVWNNTASITNMTMSPNIGNFTSGTRITVYARIV